jgi:glycosyltransferase involved in cell wall biosynthesis
MNCLIIPVYKNELSIAELLTVCEDIYTQLNQNLSVTFVVDGSPDNSYLLLLQALEKVKFSSKLVLLSRNFGAISAVQAGLSVSEGEFYAIMAADLQEPPKLIIDFFNSLRSGESDICFGVRDRRSDSMLTTFFSKVYWLFYRKIVLKDIPIGGIDMFGCSRQVRDVLVSIKESRSSLVGQLFRVGFRRAYVPYIRLKRLKGKSAWTFSKRVAYFMDSVFSFTDIPIKLLLYTGFSGTLIAFIMTIIVLISKIFGSIPVSGYAATIILILFFGAIITMGLGIVGTYVHRAYENTKNRPLSVISNVVEYKK